MRVWFGLDSEEDGIGNLGHLGLWFSFFIFAAYIDLELFLELETMELHSIAGACCVENNWFKQKGCYFVGFFFDMEMYVNFLLVWLLTLKMEVPFWKKLSKQVSKVLPKFFGCVLGNA